MNFRSVNDLNTAIIKGLKKIPRDIDLIVGIPRSGLLPATLLATYLERPLTDVDGLLNQRVFITGRTRKRNIDFAWDNNLTVLIVDDSVDSGKSLQHIQQQLSVSPFRFITLAVYVTPPGRQMVDICLDVCPLPRIFQWNVMHNGILERACLDIDGVLCRDPLDEENDDGERYIRFLQDVEPLHIPSVKVKALVTNRLEKYRHYTETWLERYGVQYDKLIMQDFASKEERQRAGEYAQHKARAMYESDSLFFIESALNQAVQIASIVGKPVLCTENWQLIMPDYRPRNAHYYVRLFYTNHGYRFPWLVSLRELYRRIRQKYTQVMRQQR